MPSKAKKTPTEMLTIYKASAGSGKTFTLAYEYLKILLGIKNRESGKYHLNSDKYNPSGHRQPRRHAGILAITFTNAATEEMKSRIIKALDKLTRSGLDNRYSQWLTNEYGCTVDELQQAASKALSELLYDYGNFNVSTIDSFFQNVLRTFSREVDHQDDYELSMDTEDMVRQSISLMLDELNYSDKDTHPRLKSWINSFTMERLRSGKSYNFFNRSGDILSTLGKHMSDSIDETFGRFSEALENYLAKPERVEIFGHELKKHADKALQPIIKTAKEFFALVKASGTPIELYNKSIVSRMEDVIYGRSTDIINTIRDFANGTKKVTAAAVGTKCKQAGIKPDSLMPQLEKAVEFCQLLVQNYQEYRFYKELDNNLGLFDFNGMAILKLRQFLRDNNTVLISDTGELLRRIISDAEMPFIYERLGMQLTNLLIDEFQDTSHLQWENLKPLVGNALSQGNDNLIIGDEKQAIYRFRNSDSKLLGHIVQTRDFPNDFIPRGSAQADNTNHRSAANVVKFNNTIYSRIARRLNMPGYDNVVQAIDTENKLDTLPGYVKMRFYDKAPDSTALLEQLAQDILRQHNEGGYAWRDILILGRWNKDIANVVDFLINHHPEIKVLSSEALLLSSSAAVRTIMSMLKLVESSYKTRGSGSPDQRKTPKYATQDEVVMMITRFDYYKSQGFNVADSLRLALDTTGDSAQSMRQEIMDIRAKNPANLVALIDAVIATKIPEQQRTEEYAYIAALQDLAIKHCEGADTSLKTFIDNYEANIDSWAIKSGADIDAVQVMTIHKSKGLERECVHIPFGDWRLKNSSQRLWLPMTLLKGFKPDILPPLMQIDVTADSPLRDPSVSPFTEIINENEQLDIIDNLNISYVAYTRAGRELIVNSTTTNIGAYVLEAISQSDEVISNNTLNTAKYYNPVTKELVIGEPTTWVDRSGKKSVYSRNAGEYPVKFRADTEQITGIDDALAVHVDIGNEEQKEIVEPAIANPSPEYIAAREQGIHLHAILAGTSTLDSLDTAVEKYATRADLPTQTAAQYRHELLQAIEGGGEKVLAWFDPSSKIYTERSIYIAATDQSFRPDRLVVYPDGKAAIVDYKFTSEPRPSHFRQMENYLTLSQDIGYKDVRGFLWYPILNKIIEIKPNKLS